MSQRPEEFPTMIIPKGTEIKVNEKGPAFHPHARSTWSSRTRETTRC